PLGAEVSVRFPGARQAGGDALCPRGRTPRRLVESDLVALRPKPSGRRSGEPRPHVATHDVVARDLDAVDLVAEVSPADHVAIANTCAGPDGDAACLNHNAVSHRSIKWHIDAE